MCVGEALWRHSLGVEAFLGRAYLWQNWFPLFLSCSWHLHSKIQDQERGSREYGVGLIPEEERIFDFFFSQDYTETSMCEAIWSCSQN